MIFSTTADPTRGNSQLHVTQIYGIALGLGAMVLMLSIDYRTLRRQVAHHLHRTARGAGVCAVQRRRRMGAKRWIRISAPSTSSRRSLPRSPWRCCSPSSSARIAARRRGSIWQSPRCLPACRWRSLPRNPISALPSSWCRWSLRWDIWPACLCACSAHSVCACCSQRPVAWQFALKDYQKARITSFLDPSQDAKDSGYQQIQARITVGSGGLTGKGFKQGTQGQLRFLPVAHNDFIFSVLAEEQGFAGVLVALGLYLFVILRVAEAARLAKGSPRLVSRDRFAGQLHLPGGLQRHHVGRTGSRQRAHASAHELWRLFDDRHARRIRPGAQRPHAQIHQLIRLAGLDFRLQARVRSLPKPAAYSPAPRSL